MSEIAGMIVFEAEIAAAGRKGLFKTFGAAWVLVTQGKIGALAILVGSLGLSGAIFAMLRTAWRRYRAAKIA